MDAAGTSDIRFSKGLEIRFHPLPLRVNFSKCGYSVVTPSAIEKHPDRLRIAPLVEHRIDEDDFTDHAVVDEEWKRLGEHTVEAENNPMIAMVDQERVDVRIDRIKEIAADPRFLFLIEHISGEEVVLRLLQDYDVHVILVLSSLFTRSQS